MHIGNPSVSIYLSKEANDSFAIKLLSNNDNPSSNCGISSHTHINNHTTSQSKRTINIDNLSIRGKH